MNANGVPTVDDFAAARVTSPGQSQVFRQRLYDYQLYTTAGSQQLSFFQEPIGAGVTSSLGAVVGSRKSKWDTNMNLGGQLPSGAAYYIESLEVYFQPGSSATANTFIPAALADATAAAWVTSLNDVLRVYSTGLLEFNVLQTNILREGPLGAFPPKTNFNTTGALTGTVATAAGFGNACAAGRPYYMTTPVLLQAANNFEVLLSWPGVVATPSGFNGRIGVIFDGFIMRATM